MTATHDSTSGRQCSGIIRALQSVPDPEVSLHKDTEVETGVETDCSSFREADGMDC